MYIVGDINCFELHESAALFFCQKPLDILFIIITTQEVDITETKYTVNYNGQEMSVRDYAEMMGLSYDTLRERARNGLPIMSPVRGQKPSKLSILPRPGGYADGYSFSELLEMYRKFAGTPEEIRLLMDFTGMTRRETVLLRDDLKKAMKRRVAV